MTVLQSRLSGLYFKDFGLWVARAAEALRFDSVESAKLFILTEHLADVAVLDADEPVALQADTRIVRLDDGKQDAA
jgi:hypothetical protein